MIGSLGSSLSVQSKVDVIVTAGNACHFAAKEGTRTIPCHGGDRDPIAAGCRSELARPGGNITGSPRLTPRSTANGSNC